MDLKQKVSKLTAALKTYLVAQEAHIGCMVHISRRGGGGGYALCVVVFTIDNLYLSCSRTTLAG